MGTGRVLGPRLSVWREPPLRPPPPERWPRARAVVSLLPLLQQLVDEALALHSDDGRGAEAVADNLAAAEREAAAELAADGSCDGADEISSDLVDEICAAVASRRGPAV